MRPPFAGAGHTGAAWLGENGSSTRPDGLCPQNAPLKTYNVTGIGVPVQQTLRERDDGGTVFVLNEDKDQVIADARSGVKAPDPLAIRSNVGDCVAITLTNEMTLAQQPKVNMHTHFVQFDPQSSDGPHDDRGERGQRHPGHRVERDEPATRHLHRRGQREGQHRDPADHRDQRHHADLRPGTHLGTRRR
jgi:hypothetical protein